MLIPVYTIGKVLPKEIKEKIIKREYSVSELNNIYKAILKSENNNNSNFAINAVIFFIVFAFLSYQAIKSTDSVMFGLLFGIVCYSIILAFLFWFQRVAKKQFLKLIKKYYIEDYNKIVSNSFIDNSLFGGFIISKNITRNGVKAKWIFRQESLISQCNGWNIYSENDDQQYISNPNNFEIVSAETISKFIPELLKIYNLPYGTDLTLKYNNGVLTGFVDTKTGKDISLNERRNYYE